MKKDWTEKQKKHLPEVGYWLHFYNKGSMSYSSTCLYCVMNGQVKYLRLDIMSGQEMIKLEDWATLVWNSCPGQKQINNPDSAEEFIHFENFEELEQYKGLNNLFYQKAPNDYE